jgi:predicted pyridoxine 5'-phosphate oxidase superfamily flavin-nucleotide-binding protein
MFAFAVIPVSAFHVYTSILGQNSKKKFGNPPILPSNRSCGQSRRARKAGNGNVGCMPPVQVEKVVIVMTPIIAEMEHHRKRRRRVYASGLARDIYRKPLS